MHPFQAITKYSFGINLGFCLTAILFSFDPSQAAESLQNRFRLLDLFDLEFASDPQISPDGAKIVFVRNFNDIMKDRKRSNLWIVDYENRELRPLTTGNENDFSPRWSPDGKRLLYASRSDGSVQIYVRWMDSGEVAKITS